MDALNKYVEQISFRQCVTFSEHRQLKGWQPHFQPSVAKNSISTILHCFAVFVTCKHGADFCKMPKQMALKTTNQKPEASRNGESSWNKVLEFASKHDTAVAWQWQEPVRRAGARWMQKKSGLSSYSFTLQRSGFEKPSSASLSSLLYPPDHWTKIPAGLHWVAVLMGHVRYGPRTSPSCTRQGKHWIHHNGTTHRTLTRRTAEGMHTGKSSPIGRVSKEPEQTVAVSLRTLNGEWCETRIPPKY